MKKRVFEFFSVLSVFVQAHLDGIRERRSYRRAYERLLLEGGRTFGVSDRKERVRP